MSKQGRNLSKSEQSGIRVLLIKTNCSNQAHVTILGILRHVTLTVQISSKPSNLQLLLRRRSLTTARLHINH